MAAVSMLGLARSALVCPQAMGRPPPGHKLAVGALEDWGRVGDGPLLGRSRTLARWSSLSVAGTTLRTAGVDDERPGMGQARGRVGREGARPRALFRTVAPGMA